MAGVDRVGGGFAVACARVDVAAQTARALLAQQLLAVEVLARQLVAGGGIGDEQRARLGEPRAGLLGHPEVLADLHAEGEAAAVKQQLLADGRILAKEEDAARRRMAGGKPAGLVELRVVGQVFLGHEAQPAAGDDGGAVVQLAVDLQGQADDKRGLGPLVHQRPERVQRGAQQRGLKEQVAAGIAGEAELRKDAELHAVGVGDIQKRGDFLRVFFRVGQVHARRSGHRAHHAGHGRHQSSHEKTPFGRRKPRILPILYHNSICE